LLKRILDRHPDEIGLPLVGVDGGVEFVFNNSGTLMRAGDAVRRGEMAVQEGTTPARALEPMPIFKDRNREIRLYLLALATPSSRPA
jgi:hypothetical protein